MFMDNLIPGKRYWWYINNVDEHKRSGLFTGSYDYRNGNAIFITKWGERWSIPAEEAHLKNKKKGKKN